MTIAEVRKKCKALLARIPRDGAILLILVAASSASFGLGLLAGKDMGQGSEIALEVPPTALPLADSAGAPQAGQVVASKNGTKYYLPDCAGADRIAAANKVWFASAAAAAAAGYTPAVNCKGL